MIRLSVALVALYVPVAHADDGGATAGMWSLLAPIVAIGMALATKRVLPSLAMGVVCAAVVATGEPLGALTAMAGWIKDAVADPGHLKITVFILLVAACVGVLTASGAMRAMVQRFEGLAKGRRGAMVAAWASGAVVFFDDYANCLVVGNAMQSVVDRFGVSRAKLAYIVDATAAPVASLAVVSTWVGYQVSVIEEGLPDDLKGEGFAIFVASIPYSYYAWFTLAFVGAIAFTGRDFGPMLTAEEAPRRKTDAHEGQESLPWWLAPIVIVLLVGATFGAMVVTGRSALGEEAAGAALFEILAESMAYESMILGSGLALLIAVAGVVALDRSKAPLLGRGIYDGLRPVVEALAVLFLAWTLSSGISSTGAGEYLGEVVSANLDIRLLPVVTFLISALTAFATGSSYSTMAIVLPLAVSVSLGAMGSTTDPIVLSATASVLAGSCLGDHASPISDTTVLSSIGSGVDLVTHVRTQLPYVIVVGAITAVVGYLPTGFGLSPFIALPVGALVGLGVVLAVGRTPREPEAGSAA